jgi:hypothetical protein
MPERVDVLLAPERRIDLALDAAVRVLVEEQVVRTRLRRHAPASHRLGAQELRAEAHAHVRDQELDAGGVREAHHAANGLELAEHGARVRPRRGVLAAREALLVQLDQLHVLAVHDGHPARDLRDLLEDGEDLVVAHALDATRRHLAALVGHEALE